MADLCFISHAQGPLGGVIQAEENFGLLPAPEIVPSVVLLSPTGDRTPVAGPRMRLVGPGDVAGIADGTVVRSDPAPGAADVEPNYCACVEVTPPELPWLLSPARPAGGQLRPWLVLVVVGLETLLQPGAPLPFVDAAVDELPDLRDSWGWAHIQCTAAQASFPEGVQPPAAEVGRLICPRRLRENTSYRACLVPAFSSGVAAGLGDARAGSAPNNWAWDVAAGGMVRLPVYHQWTFTTGPGGDFENLVLRLKPAEALRTSAARMVDVDRPWPDDTALTDPEQPQLVAVQGALCPFTDPPVPDEAAAPDTMAKLVERLTRQLDAPAERLAGAAARDESGPAFEARHGVTAKATLRALLTVGIDFSVPEADLRQWLNNREFTPFPALAEALLKLLEGKRLRQPVYLDVIRFKYEDVLGASSPRSVADVDFALLRAAVLEGYNERYGEAVRDFQTLVSGATPRQAEGAVAPPLYGGRHVGRDRTGGEPGWLPSLNTSVADRIAAGLGAAYVRRNQEELMAHAWEQVGAIRESNRARAVAELASGVAEKVHDRHVTSMTPAELLAFASVTAPRTRTSAETTLAMEIRASRLVDQAATPAFARLVRPAGKLARAASSTVESVLPRGLVGKIQVYDPAPVVPPAVESRPEAVAPEATLAAARQLIMMDTIAKVAALNAVGGAEPLVSQVHTLALSEVALSAINAGDFLSLAFQVEGQVDVIARAATEVVGGMASINADIGVVSELGVPIAAPLLAARLVSAFHPGDQQARRLASRESLPGRLAATGLAPVMATPQFAVPTALALREAAPEWFLPGLGSFPAERVALLRQNPRFIESFLVGINHEMMRELLWREYPTDQRGTPFRRFWPRPDGADDIPALHTWVEPEAERPLGSHLLTGSNLSVLLVRGTVLRRYPDTVVTAIRSAPPDAHGHFAPDPAQQQLPPLFVIRVDDTTSAYAFEIPDAELAARPSPETPGWFFVFQEHSYRLRFGFDTAPEPDDLVTFNGWNALSWPTDLPRVGQVPVVRDHAIAGANLGPPPGLAADDPLWNRDSADIARIALQRPFRVAVQASILLDADDELTHTSWRRHLKLFHGGNGTTPLDGGLPMQGIFYGVAENGDLLWYRYNGRGEQVGDPLRVQGWHPNSGNPIGRGFGDMMHVFGCGDGVIMAVHPNGDLHWYSYGGNGESDVTGTFGWDTNSGNVIGNGWQNFSHIFVKPRAGSASSQLWIFAVAQNGDLHWYSYSGQGEQDPSEASGWDTNSGNVIGNGWQNFSHIHGSGNVFFAVAQNGDLHWYSYSGQGEQDPSGASGWDPNSGNQVGNGWQNMRHIFGGVTDLGGLGHVIMAVDQNGDLFWYGYTGQGESDVMGTLGWHPNSGNRIGTQW